MLGQVGRHLERRVHRQVAAELIADGGADDIVVVRIESAEVHHQDPRRVVHRTADKAGEGK